MGAYTLLSQTDHIFSDGLKKLKKAIIEQIDTDIGVGIKTQQLDIFDFRAFLNIAMLLTEIERTRVLKKELYFIA